MASFARTGACRHGSPPSGWNPRHEDWKGLLAALAEESARPHELTIRSVSRNQRSDERRLARRSATSRGRSVPCRSRKGEIFGSGIQSGGKQPDEKVRTLPPTEGSAKLSASRQDADGSPKNSVHDHGRSRSTRLVRQNRRSSAPITLPRTRQGAHRHMVER